MVKSDIIRLTAGKVNGKTIKEVTAIVEAFLDTIVEEVAAGDTVKLSGFGTFEATQHAERVGRNPQTGDTLTIPAYNTPKFKPSKIFKEAVNEQ